MKTKHVLMAMALPTAFAACTSEDLIEEQSTPNLNGRELLSSDFKVTVPEQVNSRFVWNNFKWGFEEGDQFGAAVVDPTTIDEISNSMMLGNYIFSKQDNGWATNSQMVVGTYMYYSYDGFQNKNSRDLVKFDLGTQSADLSKPEEVVNGKQLFFSPLYKLEAKYSNEPLALGFYSYWSTAAFKMKNTTGQDLKISQIVLKDTKGFVVKGEINPKALADKALLYAYNEEKGVYELNAKKFETANGAGATYDKVMQTANIAKADEENGSTTTIALNCNGYNWADNADVTAYMVVPAHNSTNLSVSIIVVDEEGQSKEITVEETSKDGTASDTKTIGSTGISTLQFSRGLTNPVFGFNTDGKTMKTLTVKEENLDAAAGFYVESKEELLNVINSNRGEIEFYNFGELAIDDEIAKAITEYTGAGVTFNNPISVKCTGEVELGKTTFAENVTVESGKVTFGADVELAENKALTVKGGTLTLADGTYNNSTSSIVVEGGELIIDKAKLLVSSIVNKGGVVTINKAVNASDINLSFEDTKDEAGKAIPTTLNVKEKLTVNKEITTGENTTVVNSSYIQSQSPDKFIINGVLENKANCTVASVKVSEDASVKNFGEILYVDNNGIIVTNEGSRTTLTKACDSGIIDNTAKAYVNLQGKKTEAVVLYNINSEISTEDLTELIGTESNLNSVYKVNTIVFNAKVNVNKTLEFTSTYDYIFAQNSSLYVEPNANPTLAQDSEISITGNNVVFSGWDAEYSKLTGDSKKNTITLKNNSKLTIKNITLNNINIDSENAVEPNKQGKFENNGVIENTTNTGEEDWWSGNNPENE